MENREELLTEILRRVQRNYVHMAEIERITKDLGDALSRNDQESAQLLIKMRQDEMERADEVKQEIRMLVQAGGDEKEKLMSWLKGEEKYPPEIFEEKKIAELSQQLIQAVNRTVNVDKFINSRVAGEKSYYKPA